MVLSTVLHVKRTRGLLDDYSQDKRQRTETSSAELYAAASLAYIPIASHRISAHSDMLLRVAHRRVGLLATSRRHAMQCGASTAVHINAAATTTSTAHNNSSSSSSSIEDRDTPLASAAAYSGST
eukprot:17558-Heterococcus_DN1.PRE.1